LRSGSVSLLPDTICTLIRVSFDVNPSLIQNSSFVSKFNKMESLCIFIENINQYPFRLLCGKEYVATVSPLPMIEGIVSAPSLGFVFHS
jgi:hypothetical protein